MSKIISMPSNNVYRENWDRIFGKDEANNTETETQESGKASSCTCGGCGCGKKARKEKA